MAEEPKPAAGAPPASPAPPPARAASPKPGRSDRGKGGMSSISEVLGETGSPDRPTRRMADVFVLGLVGIAAVSSAVARHFWRSRHHAPKREWTTLSEQGEELQKMLERSQAEANRVASLINLGSFIVDFKVPPGADPAARQVQYLADIEITLACDVPETRAYIEKYQEQFKDRVNQAMIGLEREAILSREGKKQLKKALIKRLNEGLPEGKVVDLFFTRLLVS